MCPAILDRLGLSASQITGWLTPIDDGDGNDNTLLWEFRDVIVHSVLLKNVFQMERFYIV